MGLYLLMLFGIVTLILFPQGTGFLMWVLPLIPLPTFFLFKGLSSSLYEHKTRMALCMSLLHFYCKPKIWQHLIPMLNLYTTKEKGGSNQPWPRTIAWIDIPRS